MSETMSCRRPCEQSVSLFVILTTKTPDVTKFSHARRGSIDLLSSSPLFCFNTTHTTQRRTKNHFVQICHTLAASPTERMKFALFLCIICQALAFGPQQPKSMRSLTQSNAPVVKAQQFAVNSQKFDLSQSILSKNTVPSSLAGIVTSLVGVSGAVAADDYELAELPPPYVPAVFAVVLLIGVGVLTGSLGDVMDEGEIRMNLFIFG